MTEAAVSQTSETVVETAQPSATENSFAIPEAYQEKGWTKTITSIDDLWKQYDNAQSLIGRKTVPDADAPKEKWDEFYKSLGRPDAPDGYELSDSFELPEEMDLSEYKSKASHLAHQIGLTPKQANDLWNGYMKMELESAQLVKAEHEKKQAELDKQFDELSAKVLGDNAEKAQEMALAYIKDVLPEELQGVGEDIADNPKAMLAMIKLAQHSQTQIAEIKKKYGAEDTLQSGQQSGAMTQEDVLKKIRETKEAINASPVFSKQRTDLEADLQRYRSMIK